MLRNAKSAHRLTLEFCGADSRPEQERRAQTLAARIDREQRKKNTASQREIASLRKDYLRKISKLIGALGTRELAAIRKNKKLARSRRIRKALALIEQQGVNRDQMREIQQPYLTRAEEILSQRARTPYKPLLDAGCDTPWTTYAPPYNGYVWSFDHHQSGSANSPGYGSHLYPPTGGIGSDLHVIDKNAGDNDGLYLELYTGLNVWHTPTKSGPLEVSLVFTFVTSTFEGTIKDEFGFSDIVYTQYGLTRMTASDIQNPVQTEVMESKIYGFTHTVVGGDTTWSDQVANSGDSHTYAFRTTAAFEQGSTVFIEAGISHIATFNTNDESVDMSADLNLRLDGIMVRSCDDVFL